MIFMLQMGKLRFFGVIQLLELQGCEYRQFDIGVCVFSFEFEVVGLQVIFKFLGFNERFLGVRCWGQAGRLFFLGGLEVQRVISGVYSFQRVWVFCFGQFGWVAVFVFRCFREFWGFVRLSDEVCGGLGGDWGFF